MTVQCPASGCLVDPPSLAGELRCPTCGRLVAIVGTPSAPRYSTHNDHDEPPAHTEIIHWVKRVVECRPGLKSGSLAAVKATIEALWSDGWRPSDRVITARLTRELDAARQVLRFADGLAVSNTGFSLADLYAEDYAPAQDAIKAAGCWERGAFKAAHSEDLST